eukprot:gnl/Spiro4/7628_TR4012_c0_g1_i1.p1 gnl/Spiro4/7628_TR4012_c0_g1~~gnl/Spiro4/7628_TR4012_c0_g1_i1.p1  ORF type:complete len:391 (+),score=36.55 gnl/Spiro4/7628_TR4012_c0_g1_i1:105-1277(+)
MNRHSELLNAHSQLSWLRSLNRSSELLARLNGDIPSSPLERSSRRVKGLPAATVATTTPTPTTATLLEESEDGAEVEPFRVYRPVRSRSTSRLTRRYEGGGNGSQKGGCCGEPSDDQPYCCHSTYPRERTIERRIWRARSVSASRSRAEEEKNGVRRPPWDKYSAKDSIRQTPNNVEKRHNTMHSKHAKFSSHVVLKRVVPPRSRPSCPCCNSSVAKNMFLSPSKCKSRTVRPLYDAEACCGPQQDSCQCHNDPELCSLHTHLFTPADGRYACANNNSTTDDDERPHEVWHPPYHRVYKPEAMELGAGSRSGFHTLHDDNYDTASDVECWEELRASRTRQLRIARDSERVLRSFRAARRLDQIGELVDGCTRRMRDRYTDSYSVLQRALL